MSDPARAEVGEAALSCLATSCATASGEISDKFVRSTDASKLEPEPVLGIATLY